MNFVFGLFWLVGAIGLFVYEGVTGKPLLVVRGLNISSAWLMLVFAAWSLARWYNSRAHREQQDAVRILHEERLREARHRERPIEPDPNFDFSDKPHGNQKDSHEQG